MNGVTTSNNDRIKIERPTIQTAEQERLWQDVLKFSKLVPFEPDPNMGRVQEIKEEIGSGEYLSQDKIQETAARLAVRFFKKE